MNLPTNTYYTGKVRDVMSHARSAKRKPNRRCIVGAGDTDPRVVQKSGAMMEFLLTPPPRGERGGSPRSSPRCPRVISTVLGATIFPLLSFNPLLISSQLLQTCRSRCLAMIVLTSVTGQIYSYPQQCFIFFLITPNSPAGHRRYRFPSRPSQQQVGDFRRGHLSLINAVIHICEPPRHQ